MTITVEGFCRRVGIETRLPAQAREDFLDSVLIQLQVQLIAFTRQPDQAVVGKDRISDPVIAGDDLSPVVQIQPVRAETPKHVKRQVEFLGQPDESALGEEPFRLLEVLSWFSVNWKMGV